jgi:hypothetical protein
LARRNGDTRSEPPRLADEWGGETDASWLWLRRPAAATGEASLPCPTVTPVGMGPGFEACTLADRSGEDGESTAEKELTTEGLGGPAAAAVLSASVMPVFVVSVMGDGSAGTAVPTSTPCCGRS